MSGLLTAPTIERTAAVRAGDHASSCPVCHCTDEGCDTTTCHGLDAD